MTPISARPTLGSPLYVPHRVPDGAIENRHTKDRVVGVVRTFVIALLVTAFFIGLYWEPVEPSPARNELCQDHGGVAAYEHQAGVRYTTVCRDGYAGVY